MTISMYVRENIDFLRMPLNIIFNGGENLDQHS